MTAIAALTEAQRNGIAKSNFLFDSYGVGAPRGEFKARARAGELDHLYAELVAHEAAEAAAEKAAKKSKSDAWRAKNLPKLAAAKRAREEAEAEAKIAYVREMKNAQARQEADRAAQAECAAPVAPFIPAERPVRTIAGFPATGRITEEDASIYGSVVLGYEGETWEKFHRDHPTK